MLASVLLIGFLAGSLIALLSVVYGTVLSIGAGRRPRPRQLRAVALLLGGMAVAMYAWGMAHAGMAVLEAEDGGTDSSPPRPCREGPQERIAKVVNYEVGFLPLRLECRLSGGRTHVTSSVPGYVNPAAALLGVPAGCAVLAAARTDRSPMGLPQPPAHRPDSTARTRLPGTAPTSNGPVGFLTA